MKQFADQASHADEPAAFPLFLSRDEQVTAIKPPPLTAETMLLRFYKLTGVTPAVFTKAVLGCVAALPPVIALVTTSSSPTIAPPSRHLAEMTRNDVAEALQVVELFEARAGFAGRLTMLRQDPAVQLDKSQSTTSASATVAADPVPPDPVALVIVRNLPQTVSFSSGQSAGPGAWAIAAADLGLSGAAFGDGLDAPVAIDVEMISQAGVLLAELCMELRQDGMPPSPLSLLGAEIAAPVAQAAPDDEALPKKPTRHARTHPRTTIAHADTGAKKHVRRTREIVKAPADDDATEQTAESVANADAGAQNKPGMVKKFFTWLKGNKNDPEAQAEAEAEAVAGRHDDRKAGLLRQH